MSAPQLPQVSLDDDWFRPGGAYNLSAFVRQRSSSPPRHSNDMETARLSSKTSSSSSQPTSYNVEAYKSDVGAVRRYSYAGTDKLPTTPSIAQVPIATPDNQFLGFCKSAWSLQNGDQKGSMKRCSEADAWSRNAARKPGHAQYLKCREPKCDFRSNFVSSSPFLIWNKVFIFEERGIKLRWPFLAKSHVPQRVVLKSKYSFQCIFCVYLGHRDASIVYNGMELYLDHISKEHRGKPFSDVIQYKTRCIGNRVADDKELFDINIWPRADHEAQDNIKWLSNDLLEDPKTIPTLVQAISPSTRDPKGEVSTPPAIQSNGHAPSTESERRFGSRSTQAEIRSKTKEIPGISNMNTCATEQTSPCDILSLPFERLALQSPLSLSRICFSPYDRPSSIRETQVHPGIGETAVSGETRNGIIGCLDSIVRLFRDAGSMIDAIKDDTALSHAPIMLLLAESVKEAPSEIEKEKNRATLRFGEAFQYGDFTAIRSLEQVVSHLRSDFLDLLNEALLEHKPVDFAQLVDAADSLRHKTFVILHDLKQRLVQSGYGSYRPPGPRAHPAHQALPSSGSSTYTPPTKFFGIPLQEQRCYMLASGRGVHVEDESTFSVSSATSEHTSVHVRFRQEDITAKTARRRGSIMGFLKHGSMKSSHSLLVDSKRRSDELAGGKTKYDSTRSSFEPQMQSNGQQNIRLDKSVI